MKTIDAVYQVRISAKDPKLLDALPWNELDTGCTGGVRTQPDGTVALEAYVKRSAVKAIEKTGCRVQILANARDEIRKAMKQVGKGNRFQDPNKVPRGLGRKVPDQEVC